MLPKISNMIRKRYYISKLTFYIFIVAFAICTDGVGECGGWGVGVGGLTGGWKASCFFTRIDAGPAACHAATISPLTNEPCLSDGRQMITLLF